MLTKLRHTCTFIDQQIQNLYQNIYTVTVFSRGPGFCTVIATVSFKFEHVHILRSNLYLTTKKKEKGGGVKTVLGESQSHQLHRVF